jgi:hypothetical protein
MAEMIAASQACGRGRGTSATMNLLLVGFRFNWLRCGSVSRGSLVADHHGSGYRGRIQDYHVAGLPVRAPRRPDDSRRTNPKRTYVAHGLDRDEHQSVGVPVSVRVCAGVAQDRVASGAPHSAEIVYVFDSWDQTSFRGGTHGSANRSRNSQARQFLLSGVCEDRREPEVTQPR